MSDIAEVANGARKVRDSCESREVALKALIVLENILNGSEDERSVICTKVYCPQLGSACHDPRIRRDKTRICQRKTGRLNISFPLHVFPLGNMEESEKPSLRNIFTVAPNSQS